MNIPVYNLMGEEVANQDLNPNIFEIKANPVLIKQVLDIQLANSRHVLAHTKTRSYVRGGGRKPWKQKGTGRARHGTIRSPLWRHGGITFGPLKERAFGKSINKKMKKKALLMTLSDKALNESLKLVDSLSLGEIKTKKMAQFLERISKGKSTLLVLDKPDDAVVLSIRNLPDVSVILADSLNVVELLKYQNVVMPVAALPIIEKVYA